MTHTPRLTNASHLATKSCRLSARSLFDGLTNSITATNLPSCMSVMFTSYSLGTSPSVSTSTAVAGRAWVAVPPPPQLPKPRSGSVSMVPMSISKKVPTLIFG